MNLRSLVQLVSAIDLKSNQLIDFLRVMGSIYNKKMTLKLIKAIGTTCSPY